MARLRRLPTFNETLFMIFETKIPTFSNEMGTGSVQDGHRMGTGWAQDGHRMGTGWAQDGHRMGTGWAGMNE